jgi:hypothetical protein
MPGRPGEEVREYHANPKPIKPCGMRMARGRTIGDPAVFHVERGGLLDLKAQHLLHSLPKLGTSGSRPSRKRSRAAANGNARGLRTLRWAERRRNGVRPRGVQAATKVEDCGHRVIL